MDQDKYERLKQLLVQMYANVCGHFQDDILLLQEYFNQLGEINREYVDKIADHHKCLISLVAHLKMDLDDREREENPKLN